MEVFENCVTEWREHVPLDSLQAHSPEQKPSPNVSKTGKKTAAQQRASKAPIIPKSCVTDFGISSAGLQLFEVRSVNHRSPQRLTTRQIAETFSHMNNIFEFSRTNPQLSPSEALRQLVQTFQTNSQNNMMNSNIGAQFNQSLQQTSGQGTPGGNFNGPQQFASPANAHLNLPNAASPASMNMSPAMQAHGLQQVNSTGSQGPSANTSPNVTNKRKRPSGVKQETDGDVPTPEANGPKVKASPRVTKRQKPGQ